MKNRIELTLMLALLVATCLCRNYAVSFVTGVVLLGLNYDFYRRNKGNSGE